jgi:hypothetical protein
VTAGSVRETLSRMRGVWHDTVTAFHPDGTAMTVDEVGSVHGPYPYDNLVYIDLDGDAYTQTNVTFRGRPLHVRTFHAKIIDGVLRFDQLGPDDPGHVGVSAGPDRIVFAPARTDHAGVGRYSEPDLVELTGPATRQRTTFLYRDGHLVRTLSVRGHRVAATADRRVPDDPRGQHGPPHAGRASTTAAFTGGTDT